MCLYLPQGEISFLNFREFQKLLGKKEPPKKVTKEDIEQLKLDLEAAKLQAEIQKTKAQTPKKESKILKLMNILLEPPKKKRTIPKF